MKTVLTLVCVLVAAQHAAAQATCTNLKQFSQTLVPACDPNDIYIKWPNYDDQSTYYTCNGLNNPVITNCPVNQYFIYVLQECGSCQAYIPPVSCPQLKTQNTPNCVASGTGTPGVSPGPGGTPGTPGLPTPYYPSSSATTEKTTTTKAATTPKSTTEGPGDGPPTPPTGSDTPATPPGPDGGSTLIPPPPTPVTPAPDVPTPSTPQPTPPSVDVDPPANGGQTG